MNLRAATPADIPALRELIEISVQTLQRHDYSDSQRAAALGTLLGVDTQLITDQTYFLITHHSSQAPIACGGWSRRRTLFGSDHAANREDNLLQPGIDAAKIRAFFVHPAYARQGLGTRLLDHCEQAAIQEGFTRFELGATLTGIPLYLRHGYTAFERLEVPLPNGETLPVVRMRKQLP
jgi:GNAT superfamily N-acetyltransferase